jgi:hypothetical protein
MCRSDNVDDTAETNWSQTLELSLSQEVGYKFEIKGTGFEGKTTFTMTGDFQRGGSTSRTVTVGQTSGVVVELEPHESVKAILSSNVGSAGIRVVYEAYLSGVTAVNYDPAYRDHHFWGLGINGVSLVHTQVSKSARPAGSSQGWLWGTRHLPGPTSNLSS